MQPPQARRGRARGRLPAVPAPDEVIVLEKVRELLVVSEVAFFFFFFRLFLFRRSLSSSADAAASASAAKELAQGAREEGKGEDRSVVISLAVDALGPGGGGDRGVPSPASRRRGGGGEPGCGRGRRSGGRGRGFFFERFVAVGGVVAIGPSPDSAPARRAVGPHLRRGAAEAHALIRARRAGANGGNERRESRVSCR